MFTAIAAGDRGHGDPRRVGPLRARVRGALEPVVAGLLEEQRAAAPVGVRPRAPVRALAGQARARRAVVIGG